MKQNKKDIIDGRIFVCGDTHGGSVGDLDKLTSRKFPEGKELTKEDYVIVLGDFGFLWSKTPSPFEKDKYKWFDEKPWTTLFLDGNHENFTRLDNLPLVDMFGSKVGKVTDSIYHLKRGEVYTINNKTFFTMGGGFSIDKLYRRENVSWWEREMPSKEEYTKGYNILKKYDHKVDYVLSHTCSGLEFNELSRIYSSLSIKISGEEELRDFLNYVVLKVDYSHHYFGHFHIDYKTKYYTAMYNKVEEII